jgi:3-methylfumaryl-CoA hydratase
VTAVHLTVDPVVVDALARLLGAEPPAPGDELPPLWHWAALARWPDPAVQGNDGHPRPGTGVVPATPYPRRMFGGGTVRFHAPLLVGEEVTVTTSASEVVEKEGRSGPLALVDLTVEVSAERGPLLTEVQHLVYRPACSDTSAAPEVRPVLQVPRLLVSTDAGWELHTDAGMLARFSALTANPHRIHLDWPYATTVEGYPGLVVHGPLQAVVLAEVARRSGVPTPAALRHRGTAPLFCGQPAALHLDRDAGVAEVRTGTTTHARLELLGEDT